MAPSDSSDSPHPGPVTGLRLQRPTRPGEHRFAQELIRENMEALTRRHWGEWRGDLLAGDYPAWESYLIHEGGVPVGYIGVEPEGATLAVHNLQIRAASRGRGIGRWAVGEIIRLGRSRHCTTLRGTVFKDNPALEFFRRQGFEIADEDEHCVTIQMPI